MEDFEECWLCGGTGMYDYDLNIGACCPRCNGDGYFCFGEEEDE